MTSLHQRAKELFLQALERPADERETFVADACAADADLRAEVDSLLAFHAAEMSGDQGEAFEPHFAPGEVIANRYRMVARIGRGGMGDVWRADDLVLKTAVALKLISSTSPAGRARILNEVRLARQITHRAVCRVFDVGEAEGIVFYSMELIRGEDLAALIRRVGRLPSEKVADIGRQLCSGLAAAHAQGVLHRDLKPANVLIDDRGQVRITDFGIAIPRSDANQHMRTGTPRYMAPEQRVQGADLSERTDIYALGVLLYELLVGRFPHRSGDTLPKPSTLAPNVNSRLERVIMQALAQDPRQRPASAMAMAASLPDSDTRDDTSLAMAAATASGRRAPWWLAGGALAAVVAVLAVASSALLPFGARALTTRDVIVVADFENGTGEMVFDGALKVALAVALEQSPFLKVFPDDRARDTLLLMRRSPDERITPAIAREIARREQIKAMLSGSITKLGQSYVLTLQAINAETGDVMAREQTEAARQEEVLTALGTATSSLRQKLGESLASIQKFDAPLPRATTPSLEALNAYALALSDGREVPRLEAVPHLERAIELDPNFAMAQAQLSAVYANTGQSALAPAYSRAAFELRDRVSQRERFYISWRYFRDAAQDWEQALELARTWTATYPREAPAFNSLGVALIRFGRFDESLGPFRKAIEIDPKLTPAYSNLAASLLALDKYADARQVLRDAESRQLVFIGARRLSYLLAFVEGDTATMQRELDASIGVRETNAAFGWQAHSDAFHGRVRAAHEAFRRGIQMSLQGNFREVAAQLTLEDAETHAIAGECTEAKAEATAGLELSRDNTTLERASRTLALCGHAGEATALTAELSKRFPNATLTTQVFIPITNAALALQRGDARRVLDVLEPVRKFDRAPSAEFWPNYLRGLAFLQLKDGTSAATELQHIVDHRGEVPASMFYTLAHLGLARAAVLRGDGATARKEYEAFLAFWKDADGDTAPIKDARAEYGRLQTARTSGRPAS